jgi:hypothetical protein
MRLTAASGTTMKRDGTNAKASAGQMGEASRGDPIGARAGARGTATSLDGQRSGMGMKPGKRMAVTGTDRWSDFRA